MKTTVIHNLRDDCTYHNLGPVIVVCLLLCGGRVNLQREEEGKKGRERTKKNEERD